MHRMVRHAEAGAVGLGRSLRPLIRPLVRLIEAPVRLQERARRRGDLSTLDDHLLRDIGLTRSMTDAALTKRFWRR